MVTIDSSTNEITCYTGEAFTLNYYFWTDVAHTAAKDMTGSTVRFTVKRTKDVDLADTKAVIKIDEVTTSPNPTNLVVISLESTGQNDGTNIVAGQYYYDVKVHPVTSEDYYVTAGKFTVTQGVTNR
jgi:hypothetical protein